MSASTKKRLLWAGGILLALVLLAVGMGVYYAGQAKRALDQVTQPGASQREVSVYVLTSDPAQNLSDAAGYLFGSLAGEEEAVARLEDALRLCRDRYRPQFVGFLDERQRALAQTLERRLGEVSLCFYGGRADAERVVAGFFPAFMEPERAAFPIVPLSFRYRKGERLQHRDVLGALLSCGIRRDKIGDILCGDGLTVVFADTEIASFLCDQIRTVRNEGVSVVRGVEGELPEARQFRELRDTIASPRLDAVVRVAVGASREEAARRIEAGLVSLNHKPCGSVSAPVQEGDILSIRGSGRFRVAELGPPTRKGRLFLTLQKYI